MGVVGHAHNDADRSSSTHLWGVISYTKGTQKEGCKKIQPLPCNKLLLKGAWSATTLTTVTGHRARTCELP